MLGDTQEHLDQLLARGHKLLGNLWLDKRLSLPGENVPPMKEIPTEERGAGGEGSERGGDTRRGEEAKNWGQRDPG